MSSAIRGNDARAAQPVLPATVAQVSRAALVRNAALGIAAGARHYDPFALEADAWGHGRELVLEVLEEAGLGPADGGTALTGPALFGLPGGDPRSTPALRLVGTVLATKRLRAGEGVSYGYRFRAERDTRVALLTGGYAQGVVRSLGGSVSVRTEGGRMPIVGRVAMDVCVLDIGDAPLARGQHAVFFGDPAVGDPSIAEWERCTGLGVDELVTAVGLHAVRTVTA